MTPDLFGHAKIRSQAPVYCIYHKVDFDGECSAAIVARNTVGCTPIGYNYGDPFPWHVFEGANRKPICYMVDASLPIVDMKWLAGLCDLVWIDHHKSKLEEAKAADFNPLGVRDAKFAACELTWGWFQGNYANIPLAVHLLGRYDAWDHSDERVLPFQWYMRCFRDTHPSNTVLWDRVFSWDATAINQLASTGAQVLGYQQAQYVKSIRLYGFETHMFGYKALACNSLPGGSQLFTEHLEASDYQLFVMFYWIDRVGWRISLYTESSLIDCGDIARRMGGGGHQSAAGYIVSVLPEELQMQHDDSHIKGVY
jgi:oligoribonuclease NrnB/cAMP/cGMP phosphodiesterase (DHH superfamily)